MKPIVLICALPALVSAAAQAEGTPDGRALYDQRCVACHIRLAGGDGSTLYTRPDHRIKSLSALNQQVTYCATQTNARWFPEEEHAVAEYLNQRYYHFK